MQRPHRTLEDGLTRLSDRLGHMGLRALRAIELSIEALVGRSTELARQVIDGDARIDGLELEIDDLCVELLGLQQPLAGDLRFVTTAMKVAPDLERIADHAVNISERVLELEREPPIENMHGIPEMARRAQAMVRGALESLMHRDSARARAVIALDRNVNMRMETVFHELVSSMVATPENLPAALRLTFVAKNLERIGDQATNICEQVVYMTEARVIKHPGADAGPFADD